jgi:hypothetical protein
MDDLRGEPPRNQEGQELGSKMNDNRPRSLESQPRV